MDYSRTHLVGECRRSISAISRGRIGIDVVAPLAGAEAEASPTTTSIPSPYSKHVA
jgi:hypothetical protein